MVTWFSLYVHMTWIPFCCREKWICSYSIWEILECLRIFAMTHARDWAGRTTRSTVLKENRNKKKFHTKMLCVCSVDFPEAAKHVQLHFFFLCGRRDSSPSNPPMFSTLHWPRQQSVGFVGLGQAGELPGSGRQQPNRLYLPVVSPSAVTSAVTLQGSLGFTPHFTSNRPTPARDPPLYNHLPWPPDSCKESVPDKHSKLVIFVKKKGKCSWFVHRSWSVSHSIGRRC